jgi:hypothetical protein
MASAALLRFREVMDRADVLMGIDSSGLSRREVQAVFGAVFLTQVAAWNAYVVGLVRAFYVEVANAAVPTFHAMHTISSALAEMDLGKFNTPNADKSRELIVVCTGYDPWPDWGWPRAGLSALAVQQRINEILKVRHSFAHGFAMPTYGWNVDGSGHARLTRGVLIWNRSFFRGLAVRTDAGMKTHIKAIYGCAVGW